MKAGGGIIDSVWSRGGPFVGETRAIGRVTVEVDSWLWPAHDPGIWHPTKLPVRWFQAVGNPQLEQEVPNIRTINTDRSIDTDAATCEITMANQWMNLNSGEVGAFPPYVVTPPEERDSEALGEPGFFTFNHGASAEARARWGQTQTTWWDILVPNARLRTYEGFGGAYPMTIPEAVAAGHLTLSGLWLVDSVKIASDGMMTLSCRDMAKLLIEQKLMPPLVPASSYPIRHCRWVDTTTTVTDTVQTVVPGTAGAAGADRTLRYDTTANLAWYADGTVHGHHPSHAFDGNLDSFWLSVGNDTPNAPYAVEWVQGSCGELIDTVFIHPFAGNFTCWVSILENGAWVDEIGTIAYDPAGIGRYTGEWAAAIPAAMSFGVPWESPIEVRLPRVYRAEKVRFTFSNLADTEWGPYGFRAGARELRVRLSEQAQVADQVVVTESQRDVVVRSTGSYADYSDIVKELLLWSGWWLASVAPHSGTPVVFGYIDLTGSYSEVCLPDDAFDKRAVIDAITTIKEAVGFVFYVGDDGGANFRVPNWWGPGNYLEDGSHTDYIPTIDEKMQLTSYAVECSDRATRSEIIVSASDPMGALMPSTLVTRYTPATAASLKGMIRPAIFPTTIVMDQAQQQKMVELIALHIHFQQRLGSVRCVANPNIGINDQVRVYERITGDTFVHYVRGKQTSYDAEAGTCEMTLTTHWLGDSGEWALQ